MFKLSTFQRLQKLVYGYSVRAVLSDETFMGSDTFNESPNLGSVSLSSLNAGMPCCGCSCYPVGSSVSR